MTDFVAHWAVLAEGYSKDSPVRKYVNACDLKPWRDPVLEFAAGARVIKCETCEKIIEWDKQQRAAAGRTGLQGRRG